MYRNFYRTMLLGCVSGLALTPAAMAQDGTEDVASATTSVDDTILVKGFRSSIETSTAIKKNSTSIVEAVTAEDIGKLPDISIAESLSRLPGLATQRLDGRANVLTIRGLGPDFSTALLNGREQVSVSDNRNVEFDQYPSEILSGATVYKTPYAGLIGQGLAGTVDLQTIRPLDKDDRIISFGARYELNENGSLNPDSPNWGWRGTATLVDHTADKKVGVALGVAYQSSPTQSERFYSWGYPTTTDGDGVIGGAKPYNQSNDLDRVGVVGILEFQPTDELRMSFDGYYSHFKETQQLRGIEFPFAWGGGRDDVTPTIPGPSLHNYTVEDGLVVSGVFEDVVGVMRNDVNKRKADLYAAGWNARYDNDSYGVEVDISYSRADRHDDLIESYSGTGYNRTGVRDTIAFDLRNGYFNLMPTLDYGDASQFVLTDPQGWGGGARTQAGFINSPDTKDELWHFKGEVNKYIEDCLISNIVLGADYGMRDKTRDIGQNYLIPPGGGETAPLPTELDKQAGMSWLGIDAQVTYDPLALLDSYVYEPVGLSSFSVPQSWDISEDVFVSYLRFDIDGELGSVPVTGNIGVQAVHSDQTSSGYRVDQGASVPTFIPFDDGAKYWDVLPSANLIFDVAENTKIRASVAKTLVRARMDKLNASLSLSENSTQLTSTDPLHSYFSASGGNPQLRPYKAWGYDLSVEHYFGGAAYFAISGFYKDLEDYVFNDDGFLYDFAAFVDTSSLSDTDKASLGTTVGRISGPTNRGKGSIKGVEATLSLPFDMFSEALSGFGIIASGSFNDSNVLLGDSTDPITVPGLSKWVANSTLYFEEKGFEARVSHRFRTTFLAEVSGISATRELRFADGESIIDAQIGYRLQGGPLEGLYIYVQGTNLTDEPFITYDNADIRYVRDYQSYGRTYAIGASFTF